MKVLNRAKGKMVEVRNLKKVVFLRFPNFQFFVHRSIGEVSPRGFSVTEVRSGACLVWNEPFIQKAVHCAEEKLSEFTESKLRRSVEKAVNKRKEVENGKVSNTK